jgi:hypothetical protein
LHAVVDEARVDTKIGDNQVDACSQCSDETEYKPRGHRELLHSAMLSLDGTERQDGWTAIVGAHLA